MWWFVGVAAAWDVNSVDWTWQEARIEEGFSLHVDSFAPALDPDAVEAVFQTAIDTWNAESDADLFVVYGGRTAVSRQGGGDDGVNTTAYGSFDWGGALAVATIGFSGRKLNDCDIAVHQRNLYGDITWHIGDAPAPSDAFDLANTLTHELGHCIGLNHSDRPTAIMYAYNNPGTGDEARHLSDDDRAGLQFLYGAVLPELIVDGAWWTGTAAAGAEVDLAFQFRNIGDGSAYFVTAEIAGPGLAVALPLPHLGAPTPVGARVGPETAEVHAPWIVDCSAPETDFDLTLVDRRGHTWSHTVTLPITCPDAPNVPNDPPGDTAAPAAPGETATAGGCACDAGAAHLPGAWISVAAGWIARRRTRSPALRA